MSKKSKKTRIQPNDNTAFSKEDWYGSSRKSRNKKNKKQKKVYPKPLTQTGKTPPIENINK